MKILFALCLFCLFTTFAFSQPRLVSSEAGSITFTVTSLPASFSLPNWLTVEVGTTNTKPTLTFHFTEAETPRSATITLPDTTLEIQQAGFLNFIRVGEELTTRQFKFSEVRKAWFVPDDGEVLPNLRIAPTREGILVLVPTKSGTIFITTASGTYGSHL